MISSRAPVRISFAGGGTDVSPFTEKYEGAVVNIAINRYAYTRLELTDNANLKLISDDLNKSLSVESVNNISYDGNLDLLKAVIKHFKKEINGGLTLRTFCEIPPLSGLGSSASIFVSAIGAFTELNGEKRLDKYEIAELAYRLEREELKNAGGRQDQYSSAFGGLNFIEFKGNNFVRVNPIQLKRDTLLELESNLLLIHLGGRKDSGKIIESQTNNLKTKKGTLQAMKRTKELAYEVKYALIKGDLNKFGELLDSGWEQKKKFSSKISNPFIDDVYENLKKEGVIGGKITGAGGGGHMILYCSPGNKYKVIQKALKLHTNIVPFSFNFSGLQTWKSD